MMDVRVAKLVGVSAPGRWSQVHTYAPGDEKQEWGHMLAAVTLVGSGDGDLAAVGTEVVQRLHEAYYGNDKALGLARLQVAVSSVWGEFGEGIDGLVAGVVTDWGDRRIFYGVGRGRVGIILLRSGQRVSLLGAGDTFVGVSGFLQEGDGLVVATQPLLEASETVIAARFWQTGNVDELVDQLTPQIHAHESSGMAGVFVAVHGSLVAQLQPPRLLGAERQIVAARGRGLTQVGMRAFLSERWRQWRVKRGERVYVGPDQGKRKGVVLTVIFFVGVLLGLSLLFGVIRQRTSVEARQLHETQVQVERLLAESKQLQDLNPLRARALLEEAQGAIEVYEQGSLSRMGKKWATTAKTQVDEALRRALKVYDVFAADTFLDLHLVRGGSEGKEMDFDGKELVVLDQKSAVLLGVTVASKKAGVVGGGSLLSGVKAAAVWGKRGFVVSNAGVVELDLVRKTSAVAIPADPEWGEIGTMDVFGGNLYLLDKQNGEIYRYTQASGGFGPRKNWLGQGVAPDFSGVVSMAIDGSIWILTKTGKIEVYSQGTGRAVGLKGLDIPLAEPNAVYTDQDSEQVYILDPGNKRVVVVSKEGQYEAQYRWEGIGGATDLVVSEVEKKILLLSGSTIYSLELK